MEIIPKSGKTTVRTKKQSMSLLRFTKGLKGNETGVTLIEVLVSLAILSLIAVAFMSSLATASKATSIADEQATAESLARSQMEYAKDLPYDEYGAWAYTPAELPSGDDYYGYSATIFAHSIHNPDDGIQRITVTINHYDEEVLTVVGYKVDR